MGDAKIKVFKPVLFLIYIKKDILQKDKMGLFNKKNQREDIKKTLSEMPRLPELPALPELPSLGEDSNGEESIPKLPSFPLNSLGTKFSQNTIKEVVSGEKEGEGVYSADEFPYEEDSEIMHKPLKKPLSKEVEEYEGSFSTTPKSKEIPRGFAEERYLTRKAEPIFIRIDKFEESMNLFEKIKKQISEIEGLIKNTKGLKEKEEEELAYWENQIQGIKKQIEKVDQDIFSKIE